MKIVMAIPSAIGHLNPSFFIARKLTEVGHQVIYLATPDALSLIELNGFEYVSATTVLFSGKKSTGSKISYWERVANKLQEVEPNNVKRKGELFLNVISGVNPDIVLLDSIISYNYFFIRKHFPVMLLQTMLSTYQDHTPPLTSLLLNKEKILFKTLSRFEWHKYYIKNKVLSFISLGDTQFNIIKRLFKKEIPDFDRCFLKKKTFQYGLADVPEIILSPASFDFPNRNPNALQYHAGLCLNNFSCHEAEVVILKELLDKLPLVHKLVYCSLGTLSSIHYNRLEKFYNLLIKAFKNRSEYLVISIGDFDKVSLAPLPSNVFIFKNLNQKYLLSRADMMITHAGLNSILECINYKVPMLALPLNSEWDQNGNSSRIIYHRIGIRAKINSLTVRKLNSLVTDVINNPVFKKNIDLLKEKFESDDNKIDPSDLIEKMVKEWKYGINKKN
jgi:zeaxanthin glucosyltransferase